MPLASLQGAVAEAGNIGAALPAEGMRPGGAAVVLGPRNGNLWLAVGAGCLLHAALATCGHALSPTMGFERSQICSWEH